MIALLLAAALAEDPDFRGHVDQARFFMKRGWTEDALTELEAAVATEDGRVDPDVWWLLAQVRLELGDLAGAEAAAEKAHSYARSDAQLTAASALATFLRESFGTVHIDSDPGGLSSRLDIDTDTTFVDPAIGAYVDGVIARRAADPTRLPTDLQLPLGDYTINGHLVTVEANGSHALTLQPESLLVPSAKQLWRADGSLGVVAVPGASDAHGPVGPAISVGLRRLAGPVSARAALAWRPQPYARVDVAPVYGVGAGELALEVGLPLESALGVWTPSIGYAAGVLPGVELACTSVDWACRVDGEADLYVYANALVHGPRAQLWLELGDAQRKTVWAPGVRARAGVAWSTLPAGGTAAVVGGESVEYSTRPADRAGVHADLGLHLTLSHGL